MFSASLLLVFSAVCLSVRSSSTNDLVPSNSDTSESECNRIQLVVMDVLFRKTCQCYRLDVVNYDYETATKECENDEGHLAKITCPDLNKFLANWIKNRNFENMAGPNQDPWLGLICPDDNRANCKWYDGTPLTGYNNFASDQPTGNSSYVVIGIINDEPRRKGGYWYTRGNGGYDYEDESPLICQRPPPTLSETLAEKNVTKASRYIFSIISFTNFLGVYLLHKL